MSIIEVKMYTVQCNNCKTTSGVDSEFSCRNDDSYAEDEAMESDWERVDGEHHYCPDCFSYDDEDNLVLDLERKDKYETNN
jgi:hypothetical protein